MAAVVQNIENKWSGIAKIGAVVVVVTLGLWGCARRPAAQGVAPERVRSLESRCIKLEQDYRSVAAARDRARTELATLQQETARLQRELADRNALVRDRQQVQQQVKILQSERAALQQALAARTSERDDLRQQMVIRTSERDVLATRFEKIRKGLQGLLSTEEQSTQAPAMPAAGSPTSVQILGGQS